MFDMAWSTNAPTPSYIVNDALQSKFLHDMFGLSIFFDIVAVLLQSEAYI